MNRLREILLTQYIGAIVIGLLIAQALMRVIGLVLEPVLWVQESRSAFASGLSSFPFSRMLSPTLTIILYVAASYFLLVWLYGAETTKTAEIDVTDHSETQN